MKCPVCQTENENGAAFCANCGADLNAAGASSQGGAAAKQSAGDVAKTVLRNKYVRISLIALCVVILIAIIASSGGAKYDKVENSITLVENGDMINVVYNDSVLKTKVEGAVNRSETSYDGGVVAFTTEKDNILYVVNGKKVEKVAEDVTSFSLSVDGKGIAFVRKDDDETILSLYSVSGKKSKEITKKFASGLYLSPDGKSVAYFETRESKDENEPASTALYLYDGSKSTKITTADVSVAGISNGGKYIYARLKNDDGDTNFYCYNVKGEKTKLGGSGSSVKFNSDRTQVLFSHEGKTYLSIKGKEAVKFCSSEVTPILPVFSAGKSNVYPLDDFCNNVYVGVTDSGDNAAWFIKKDSETAVKLISGITGAQIDKSLKYLYYTRTKNGDTHLYCLNVSDGDKAKDKAVLIAEDVTSFLVTLDRSKAYFLTKDGEFCSANGKNGKSKKTIVSDDFGGLEAFSKKDVVYYTYDKELFACSNGKDGKKISLEDIKNVDVSDNGYVYIYTEDKMYVTTSTGKPTQLMTIETPSKSTD